jgi:ABC-type uncharacterized transport system substrate-binding protein
MAKKTILVLLVGLALGSVHLTEAQQSTKVPRIGVLVPTSPSIFSSRLEAFRQGLRDLGYVEGKGISIEYRYAEGKLDRLPHFAAELVHLKVDVILTAGEFGAVAAKNATSTIPIVFAVTEDAVESGLVSRLARPGGNVTAADLGGKRLELLKESFPTQRDRIVDFVAKNRLPAIYAGPEFVDAGGLMYYGPSYPDLFRRAATYVDKILKGTKPTDLPVEQPTKFEFVINLKTAKQLGLTIPQSVLYRADRVIK